MGIVKFIVKDCFVFCLIENLAHKKAQMSVNHIYGSGGHHALDTSYGSAFKSNKMKVPWLRVDLDETYFVHEVLIRALTCCRKDVLLNFDIRIGKKTKY